jgi:hypothetical protein
MQRHPDSRTLHSGEVFDAFRRPIHGGVVHVATLYMVELLRYFFPPIFSLFLALKNTLPL